MKGWKLLTLRPLSVESQKKSRRCELKAYIFQRFAAQHLLLELLLQLLSGTDRLLVSDEVRELFEPSVGEVLAEVLTAALVGWEQLLRKLKQLQFDTTLRSKVFSNVFNQDSCIHSKVKFNIRPFLRSRIQKIRLNAHFFLLHWGSRNDKENKINERKKKILNKEG